MESKEMLELRYKRLNYYNKLVNKSINVASTDNNNNNNNNRNRSDYFQLIDNLTLNNKSLNIKEPLSQRDESKLNSMQFINNFFEGTNKLDDTDYSLPQHHPSSNKKLEEFKKVVESSYNLHVVKKNEIKPLVQPQQEELKLRNIFTSQLSTESSLDSYRTPLENESASVRSNESNTLTYKIPYMSAYNIYTENESVLNNSINSLSNRRVSVSSTLEAQNIMEKYMNSTNATNQLSNSRKMSIGSNEDHLLTKKDQQQYQSNPTSNKLSSSGSSLNASPTSQSSSSSSFNLLQQKQLLQQPPMTIQVKPPETPRTQSTIPTFRKNLLRLSIDTAKSLDLKKEEQMNKPMNAKLTDSLELTTQSSRNEKLLNNFFNDKPVNLKPIISSGSKIRVTKKKSNKNTIFNLVNEYDDEYEEAKAEDYSNEDNNDTFDIFSSQESLEKTIEENVKNLDLNIDLALLSDHDNEESQIVNNNNNITNTNQNQHNVINYDSDQDCSIMENVKLTSNLLSSGRQQTQQKKPDNIPNLMLDLMDDDKSTQSVAASLAKSMCKEIDYQKEMEQLYTLANKEFSSSSFLQQTNQQSQRDQVFNITKKMTNKTKSSSNLPIHLNKVVGPVPTTSSAATNALKPQVSEHPIKFKHSTQKPPQSARQQRLIKNDLDLVNRPESATATSNQQTLNYNRNSRLRLSKIDLTNQQNTISNTNEAKKPKSFLSNSRDSSLSSKSKKKDVINRKNLLFLKNRPSSAMSNLNTDTTTNDTNNEFDEKRSKSTLFFNYSKLVTIESNLKEDSVDSFAKQQGDFFTNSSMIMGDQDAYKNFFSNETKSNENLIVNNQVDWLELPDEIWLKIIKSLEHKELVKFGSCCKKFRNLYLDNSLCIL